MLTIGDVLEYKAKRNKKPEPEKKKWFGTWPAKCDICGRPLEKLVAFIDGATKMGPWALMCVTCHKSHGIGLGLGRGQKYSSKTLEKIAG